MKIKTTKKDVEKTVIVSSEAKPCCCGKKRGPKPQLKKETTFTFHAEKGKSVYIAGDFNNWDPTAKKLAYKVREGVYTTTINLTPGEHQYKFVIDGTWCADPENANAVANDQGTFNSVVTVVA